MALMIEGHGTTLTLTTPAAMEFEVVSMTPPGYEGGGEINTTTMENSVYRTKQPKTLKELTDSTLTVAWDTVILGPTKILAALNVNQSLTVTFPDGATFAFQGWMNTFQPGEHAEGERPEGEMTLMSSQSTAAGVETAPVYTP